MTTATTTRCEHITPPSPGSRAAIKRCCRPARWVVWQMRPFGSTADRHEMCTQHANAARRIVKRNAA